VRHASSVGPGGQRDIAELAALCEEIDAGYDGDLPTRTQAPGVPDDAELFVKSNCGFSRAVLLARENLHLAGLSVRNVSENPEALARLEELTGGKQAPCLLTGSAPLLESKDIIAALVDAAAPL